MGSRAKSRRFLRAVAERAPRFIAGSMFLRSNKRIKDGKEHRYYTVVESRRLRSGKVAQRQVLYLGEINDSQQAAWRKTLDVFDEQQCRYTPLSLFPEDCSGPQFLDRKTTLP